MLCYTTFADQEVTEDFGRHEVFVGQRAFYQCFDTMWQWIDIGSLTGQLMKHGLVSNPDTFDCITSHYKPPREKAFSLLTVVAPQAGNYGFHLLYMCIRDARDNLGHQDAADLLKQYGNCTALQIPLVCLVCVQPFGVSYLIFSFRSDFLCLSDANRVDESN